MRTHLVITALALAASLAACGNDNSNGGVTGGTGATGATGATGPGNPNGCGLTGTWSATHTVNGGTTFTVALQSTGEKTTLDRTGGSVPSAHVDGTYTYDTAAGQITFTNTAVQTTDPNFDACIGVPGKYNLTFTDCSHFTLTTVSDTCSVRVPLANSATITKQ